MADLRVLQLRPVRIEGVGIRGPIRPSERPIFDPTARVIAPRSNSPVETIEQVLFE